MKKPNNTVLVLLVLIATAICAGILLKSLPAAEKNEGSVRVSLLYFMTLLPFIVLLLYRFRVSCMSLYKSMRENPKLFIVLGLLIALALVVSAMHK